MKNVIVTGGRSQLALQFLNLNFLTKNWKFVDSNYLDITDKKNILNVFSQFQVELVINCAAYTDVDQAQNEKEKAFLINHQGVKNLLFACDKFNAKLIHFSTDYIFDGIKKSPYLEFDKPNPLNVYGKSKLAGEIEILNSNVRSIIIRTSWLYSNFGKNFVKKILKNSHDRQLFIVDDQIGSPTYAEDLALSILEIISNKNYEWSVGDIFNFSNEGSCSWFEFASEISNIANLKAQINKISSQDLVSGAKRPSYSVMDNSKFKNIFGLSINSWRKSLKIMLKKELVKI